MKRQLLQARVKAGSPWLFFLLVYAFSIPLWVLGAVADRLLATELSTDLPFSALMFVVPVSVALVLVWRKEGAQAAKTLLKRAVDYKRIKRKAWLIPAIAFWPAVMVVQYLLKTLVGMPLAAPQVPVLAMLAGSVVFLLAAMGEEVGWQGYAIDRLQARHSALTASVLLGIVWATWHIVPLMQLDRPPAWKAWQWLTIALTRILVVWLFNNTGKSVFVAVLFHAMNNLCTVLLPSYGWPYDPLVALVIVAVAATAITFLWGPKTLARYRYARHQPAPSLGGSAAR